MQIKHPKFGVANHISGGNHSLLSGAVARPALKTVHRTVFRALWPQRRFPQEYLNRYNLAVFEKILCLTFPFAYVTICFAGKGRRADIAQLVERLIRNHQVKGSSPFIGSIFFRGVAQSGSAFGSGPKGRGFESHHFDSRKCWVSHASGFFFRRVAMQRNGLRRPGKKYIIRATKGRCRVQPEFLALHELIGK